MRRTGDDSTLNPRPFRAEVLMIEWFDLPDQARVLFGVSSYRFLRRRVFMVTRRCSLTLASLAMVTFSAALFAQQTPQPKKLTDAEKKEIQLVQKLVDDAAAGQASPNDVGLTWIREDLLKAQGNKQYLPFNVSIDPSKITGNKVTFYWRVVAKDAAAPAAEGKDAKKDDKKGGRPEYAYEDLNTVAVQSGQSGPLRISRSFTVAPGN